MWKCVSVVSGGTDAFLSDDDTSSDPSCVILMKRYVVPNVVGGTSLPPFPFQFTTSGSWILREGVTAPFGKYRLMSCWLAGLARDGRITNATSPDV